jgi:hypothetical protein
MFAGASCFTAKSEEEDVSVAGGTAFIGSLAAVLAGSSEICFAVWLRAFEASSDFTF